MFFSNNCQLKLIYYTPEHKARESLISRILSQNMVIILNLLIFKCDRIYFNKFSSSCTVGIFTICCIQYKILFVLLLKVWRFIRVKEEISVYKGNPYFINYHIYTHTVMYRNLLIIYYYLHYLETKQYTNFS